MSRLRQWADQLGVPRLILGPLLRHVGAEEATVWVKTDAACAVEVRGV